jgi:uncharacterized membrane protein
MGLKMCLLASKEIVPSIYDIISLKLLEDVAEKKWDSRSNQACGVVLVWFLGPIPFVFWTLRFSSLFFFLQWSAMCKCACFV